MLNIGNSPSVLVC